jgi:chemotaxis protein MotB
MARKKPDEGGGGPNWLDTYADMVTLLLTFFVLLFAMSTMDSAKWQKLVTAFATNKQPASTVQQGGAGIPSVSAANSALITPSGIEDSSSTKSGGAMKFDDLYQYIKSYVDQKNLSASVEVHKGDGYTFITFQNSIFFNGDSAVLLDSGKAILDYLGNGLKGVSSQIGEVRFYGHTARVDTEKTNANMAFDRQLSSDRATNVLLYVQYKNIIDPKKMVSEGYGEYRPIVPNDGTEATRMKNRRVEIYISESGTLNNTLDEIYTQISSSGKGTIASRP